MRRLGTVGNAYIYSMRRDMLTIRKLVAHILVDLVWAYLRIEVMLVYPSPPTDHALKCVASPIADGRVGPTHVRGVYAGQQYALHRTWRESEGSYGGVMKCFW